MKCFRPLKALLPPIRSNASAYQKQCFRLSKATLPMKKPKAVSSSSSKTDSHAVFQIISIFLQFEFFNGTKETGFFVLLSFFRTFALDF